MSLLLFHEMGKHEFPEDRRRAPYFTLFEFYFIRDRGLFRPTVRPSNASLTAVAYQAHQAPCCYIKTGHQFPLAFQK